MSTDFKVSFNSPQCGWMSIGFAAGDGANEFHTTTAYAPHANALSEILDGLSSFLESRSPTGEFVVYWSRNPEAFDFRFRLAGNRIGLEIFQYPSFERAETESERVFACERDAAEICEAFYQTFQQLQDDKDTDVFEFNWRQPFPHVAFERFKRNLENMRRRNGGAA